MAIAVGVSLALIGAAAASLPLTARLETQVGLGWLFALRGPRPAPLDVIVVSIDHESSRRLHLPNVPRKWPRGLHARLIERLNARGVRAIAFDVNFVDPGDPIQDAKLARAMRKAGNVLLFEYLRRVSALGMAGEDMADLALERRVPPVAPLAKAAAGLAPFPLPKVSARVSQVWLFKPSAGDAPTLPVLALQQYARPHYPAFKDLLAEAWHEPRMIPVGRALPTQDQELVHAVRKLREIFQVHPALVDSVRKSLADADHGSAAAIHRALLETYAGPDARYLDFYGPPRSITTVPYYAVLQPGPVRDHLGAAVDLRDKMVFVGFSENLQPEQSDGFYTVFSQADGLDISGVEIAATTFANLLEGRTVTPLPWSAHLMLIAGWGLLLGVVLVSLPGMMTVPAAGALIAGAVATASYLFNSNGIWLPIAVPVLLQAPLGLGGALLAHYLCMRRGRQRLHETLAVYLPKGAVAELAKPAANATQLGHTTFGVCLATDIARYTALSESMPPDVLRVLLNRYFELLFAPVRRHRGEVYDIKGDAMLAIWTEGRERELRAAACHAALDIFHAVDGFGRDVAGARLPTRIGLHCGEMELGTVGSGDHFEYRPLGDIINTATRIEGLSKHLGTWALASSNVIAGLDDIATREIGCFQPVGKSKPLIIYELLPRTDEAMAAAHNGVAFDEALREFRAGDWSAAQAAFAEYLSTHERDGPAKFYLRLCARYQRRPPPHWDGTIMLREK
jgi:adenylate cyclase